MQSDSPSPENPYLAPLMLLEPERDHVFKGEIPWLKFGTGCQMMVILAGLGLSIYKVESILWSGPILSGVGILVALLSYWRGFHSGVLTGGSGPVFSVFVFLVIFTRGWSPHDARIPVPMMISGYLVVVGVLTAVGMLQLRDSEHRGQRLLKDELAEHFPGVES